MAPVPAAVVLDMDGLILDTEPLYRQALRVAARELGHGLDDALYRRMVGHTDEYCEALLSEVFGPGFALERFRLRWPAILDGLLDTEGVAAKAGVADLLGLLDRHLVAYAVATSSHAEHAVRSLDRAGLSRRFATLVSGDEVARSKPAPDIYLEAAGRLGVPAARCIAIEDSEPGVEAAAAAGMTVLMVPDLVDPSPRTRALAEAVLPSLVEATALIESRLR